jgi:hypothetical protein
MNAHPCEDRFMKKDPPGKKRPYSPPSATKLTPDQAQRFVKEHANFSDQQAADLLASLRRDSCRWNSKVVCNAENWV